jgi:hypothetical protein
MDFVDLLVARWHAVSRGTVMSVLLLAAFLVALFFAYARFPTLGPAGNQGLGPDWECSHPGKGDPVCVKKPAPPARPGGSRSPE